MVAPDSRFLACVVIMMNTIWYTKYRNRPDFMSGFANEQAYVDAMFAMLIMYNFGVWLDPEDML